MTRVHDTFTKSETFGWGRAMAGDEASYELKSARTVRGMESRTIAKWKKEGWELVSQDQESLMRMMLTFRREKRKQLPFLLGAAGAVLLAIAALVAVAIGGDDTPGEVSAPAAATSTPTESAAPPSEEPLDEPSEEATDAADQSELIQTASAEPEPDKVLTVETSPEFSALLAEPEPGGSGVGEFAAKFEGKLIEFDGNIAYMVNHGSNDTRYDMLIRSGDYSETSGTGPNFKFEDVSVFDLNLEGTDIPDGIGAQDNFRFVARVAKYNEVQELFFLEPVSTTMR